MIILIAGDTHTGKTNLAQKLLEHYKIPYVSIDRRCLIGSYLNLAA